MTAKILLAFLVPVWLSGCGLAYTVVNSEAKLDKLSIPMTREQVVEEIGEPDFVLRDHAGVTVWQYSMTTRKQWLYELSMCPVSFVLGGCLFYPFTNTVAEYNREHPVHVVLVKDRLCTWGTLLVVVNKQRSCGTTVLPLAGDEDFGGYPLLADIVTTGSGPINTRNVESYQIMAVAPFGDAPDAPGSGTRVAGIVTALLLDLGINLVERSQLDQVFDEQALQLQHAKDGEALAVGKLGGAKALVVGDVAEWQVEGGDRTAQVSLSLRVIDLESGQLLFGGSGHVRQPMVGAAEDLARLLVHRILAKFAIRAGLLGSGRIGVRWTLRERSGAFGYVVEYVREGSPAQQAGLKEGDVVRACNGSPIAAARSEREARRACRVDAGQTLALSVERNGERLRIDTPAEPRPDI